MHKRVQLKSTCIFITDIVNLLSLICYTDYEELLIAIIYCSAKSGKLWLSEILGGNTNRLFETLL